MERKENWKTVSRWLLLKGHQKIRSTLTVRPTRHPSVLNRKPCAVKISRELSFWSCLVSFLWSQSILESLGTRLSRRCSTKIGSRSSPSLSAKRESARQYFQVLVKCGHGHPECLSPMSRLSFLVRIPIMVQGRLMVSASGKNNQALI